MLFYCSVSTLHPLSQASPSKRVVSLRERARKGNVVQEEDKRFNPEALEAHMTKAHEQAVARGKKGGKKVQCPGHHGPGTSRCRHAALTMLAVCCREVG